MQKQAEDEPDWNVERNVRGCWALRCDKECRVQSGMALRCVRACWMQREVALQSILGVFVQACIVHEKFQRGASARLHGGCCGSFRVSCRLQEGATVSFHASCKVQSVLVTIFHPRCDPAEGGRSCNARVMQSGLGGQTSFSTLLHDDMRGRNFPATPLQGCRRPAEVQLRRRSSGGYMMFLGSLLLSMDRCPVQLPKTADFRIEGFCRWHRPAIAVCH